MLFVYKEYTIYLKESIKNFLLRLIKKTINNKPIYIVLIEKCKPRSKSLSSALFKIVLTAQLY